MKENQRITLTRRLLREALLQLLSEKPLEKISVSALCRTAGINRTTFYHHYQTPSDVLTEMENELVEGLQQYNVQNLTERSTLQAATSICAYLHKHADTLRVLFRCNVDGHLATVVTRMNRSLLELRERQPRLVPLDADAMRLTATFLGTGGYYLIRQWLLDEIDKTPAEIAELMLNIVKK